jgi:hypothetical protein
VGGSLQLSATARDALGDVLTGRTVTWQSSATTMATVSPTGSVTGVAAGGPVTVTATIEGVSGGAAVTVIPIPVATVVLAPATGTVEVGATLPLTATVRAALGAALMGRPVAWQSAAPGVATVSAAGVVTGISVGGPVTITATSEGVSGTTVITVIPVRVLNVSSDSELRAEPAQVWRFHGPAARSLAARIGGQDASVAFEGDTIALITVPNLAAFQPCLSPTTLDVVLTTATGSLQLNVLAEAPLAPALAIGAHSPVDAATTRGCRIALQPGTYVLATAVTDREDYALTGQTRADSVSVRLDLTTGANVDAARAVAVPVRGEARSLMEQRPTSLHEGWPLHQHTPLFERAPTSTRGVQAANASGCANLTMVGDSILIPTRRDASGKVTWGDGTEPAEWWYLIARAPSVDVVVDTGGRRVWKVDGTMRTTVGQVVALYDTAFVRVWAELYAEPLPDHDGNGRMIWFAPWNSAVGSGGGAGIYLQSGCGTGWREGEAFYTPLDAFSSDPVRTPPYLASYFRLVVFHEATHTQDLSRRSDRFGYGRWPPGTQIAAEGIASFTQEYWMLKRSGPPLTGNQTSVSTTTDGVTHVADLWPVFPQISGNYDWNQWAANDGYPQSARFIFWVVAQAVRQGRPLSSALSAIAYASRATYGSIYRAATGSTLSDRDVLVSWALSWYADDRVANLDPLLAFTPWNTVQAYAAHGRAFPLPAARLAAAGAWTVQLGDPDVKLLEIAPAEAMRVHIQLVGTLASRVSLELLRAR